MHRPSSLHLLWQPVRAWWGLKAVGTSAFMWGFFLIYFHLLENPRTAPAEMPLTPLDAWVPFHPVAWLFYLSLWVYTSLPVALQPSLRQLIYYGLAIALLCATGLTFFYWWPTVIPVSHVLPDDHTWNLLAGVDAPGNAFPSLHVATSVFSAIWIDARLREIGLGHRWRWANGLWCLAIVLSTVATRQHVVLDVVGGLVLALPLAWLTLWAPSRFRWRKPSVAV